MRNLRKLVKSVLAVLTIFCVLLSGFVNVNSCRIDYAAKTLKKCKATKPIANEFVSTEVREDGLNADFYYNKNAKHQKAIIVFGGSDGGKGWSSDGFEKYRMGLLNQGYAVLSLGYFAVEGCPNSLESIPMEYFNTAISWILKQPGIDKKDVAVMGYSKGGEASLLLASINPKVKAVVALVPSSNVFQCLSGANKSSWSYKGEDVPYAPFVMNEALAEGLRKMNEEGKIEFVQVYKDALADTKVAEMSAIRVEKSKADILLLSGKNDVVWDSKGMSEKVIKRLQDKNYKRFYEHISYDTGHNVFESEDAWIDVLDFLKKHY